MTLSLDDRLAWGLQEHQTRLADIATVKAGSMTLEDAQKRARKRSRESGMTPHQSYKAMIEAKRKDRKSSGGTCSWGEPR